ETKIVQLQQAALDDHQKINEANAQRQQVEQRVVEMQQRHSELMNHVDQLQQQNADHLDTLESLEVQRSGLITQRDTLASQLQQSETGEMQLREQLVALRNQVVLHTADAQKLELENQRLQAVERESRDEQMRLHSEKSQLEHEVTQLREQRAATEDEYSQHLRLFETQLSDHLQGFSSERSDLESEVQRLTNRNEDLQKLSDALRAERDALAGKSEETPSVQIRRAA
ncbi:MAG: hypothetical protein AAFN70_20740, partial [Planctomycetota bacterium]